MILFDGKCINCGYDVTTEELYNDLKKKYDFEKDFGDIEKPLENILEKCGDEDLKTKYLILTFFVNVYDEKSKKAVGKEETEKYFYKKIKYQQILEEKEFSEKEIIRELARINNAKEYGDLYAVEYYKQIVSLDPNDSISYLDLAMVEEKLKHYDEATNIYKTWYQLSLKNCDICYRLPLYNEYLKNIARLFLKKAEVLTRGYGGSESLRDAKKGFFKPVLDFIEKIDLKKTADVVKTQLPWDASSYEERNRKNVYSKQFPFPVQVKGLELRALVDSEDYEKALNTYDEIVKISPDFIDHYYCEEIRTSIIGSKPYTYTDRSYFDFYDLEDSSLFASLTEMYWEIGKPNKIGEIYYKIFEDYGYHGSDWGDFWFFSLLPYLLGKSMFIYLQSISKSDIKKQLINECLTFFKIVLDFYHYTHTIMQGDEDVSPLYEPLVELMPGEGSINESHFYRGELYELLNDYDNALAEYQSAARGILNNLKVKNKIENLRKNFINDFKIESENLAKIETKEIPIDTTIRIMSLLGSIKNSFPEHYKETKILVEKIGEEMPHKLLNPLRCIAEEYFNKMYKGSRRKSFRTKVKELLDRNEIDGYIKNLLELIWSIGSRGSHPAPNYVKHLKLEDIEVIISAEVRFLNWYMEKYSKKK